MKRESCLYKLRDALTVKRRSGNSTRLIDNAIQIIFSGKVCVVQDHYQHGEIKMINKLLFDRVIKRLESEHRFSWMVKNGKIYADYINLEIYLINTK
jgi:hypothetical protein